MKTLTRLKPSLRLLVYGGLISIVSAICFSQYGFEGPLTRDVGNLVYSGQQMARGIPPYVSLFNHIGPLSPMVAGASIGIANFFNTGDLMTIRVVFFIFAILTVVAIYLLAFCLFESQAAGALSSLAFLGFQCFGEDAVSGPRAKTPMVLFQALALFFAARRLWFWSGMFGSLAFLVWQPMAVFPMITIFLAFAQSQPGSDRRRNVNLAVMGSLAPVIFACIYFFSQSAFDEMFEGFVLFNLFHLERQPSSLFMHLAAPLIVILRRFSIMAAPIFLASFALIMMYVWRVRLEGGSIRRAVSNDRFAAFLLSLPAPVIWSLLDFQGCPDLYVFLPYLAIGFGWLLYLTAQGLIGLETIGPRAYNFIIFSLCLLLATMATIEYLRRANHRLIDQQAAARALEAEFGKDMKIVSIGAPDLLFLLNRTNPNRYLFIASGIDNYIDARTPGGFEGWLQHLDAYDPSVIAVGPTSGRFSGRLFEWLRSRYTERAVVDWTLYIKEPQAARQQ